MQTNKTCENCGAEFVDRSRTQHGRFCSDNCRAKASYAANREKRLEYYKAHYASHREEIAEYGRIYRELNQEKRKAQNRAYNAAHREEKNKNQRAYRQANLEAERARTTAWFKANPEKARANWSQNYARRKGARVSPVDREVIYKRDNFTCQICKKKVEMDEPYPHPLSPSLDHILPIAKGGSHEPRNVQLAHLSCNAKKKHTGVDQLRLFGE